MNSINGLHLGALKDFSTRILANSAEGKAEYAVRTKWTGQAGTVSRPEPFILGGQSYERPFEIIADEPPQLLGANRGPNPQELLFSAINACMTVTFVAQASLRGVILESLEIRTSGTLDLRGFVDPTSGASPGFDSLSFEIIVQGNASQEQFDEILEATRKSSPNFFNVTRAITFEGIVNKA